MTSLTSLSSYTGSVRSKYLAVAAVNKITLTYPVLL